MMIKRIEGATRVLGKQQGYIGLPVLDTVVDGIPVMETLWEPLPDEIRRIVAGAPVKLRVQGTAHPPVMVEVGDAP